MMIAAGALRVLHKKTPCNISLRVVLLAAAVCMFSIVVTLPMGSVSDLYGFGPNIGSGLLIVTAVLLHRLAHLKKTSPQLLWSHLALDPLSYLHLPHAVTQHLKKRP